MLIRKLIQAVCLLPGARRSPQYSPWAKINLKQVTFKKKKFLPSKKKTPGNSHLHQNVAQGLKKQGNLFKGYLKKTGKAGKSLTS